MDIAREHVKNGGKPQWKPAELLQKSPSTFSEEIKNEFDNVDHKKEGKIPLEQFPRIFELKEFILGTLFNADLYQDNCF